MNSFNTSEAQSALFQHATIGILLADNKGEIILVNSAAEQIFSYSKHELIGKKVETLIPQRFQEKHEHHRHTYNEHPKPRPMGAGMMLWGQKKDGAEFPVEISLSPFKNEKGNFTIAFITDITTRKQQEQVLVQAHCDLKRYTEELKKFNEEIKEFGYVSSHHLQEPLRKIQTYSNMLFQEEEPNLSEHGKEYLKKILASTEVMRDRVNDFILFTRLNTSEQIRVPVNLQIVLKLVLSDLDILITQEQAVIEMQPKLPVIHADPIQMRKLFLNLVSNAIKFHKHTIAPLIKISHRIVDSPSESGQTKKIEIEFEDNGIGFDEKFNEEIFHLFKKNVESEGQGIGLAISRKICVLHGGNLTAKSKEGKGATFTVSLPVK